MHGQAKKDALRSYKERKPSMGIYAVHCDATGQVWVGQSPTLDKLENRLWFSLRMGGHKTASLQTAWNAHGGEGFRVETLAELSEDETAYPDARLKELREFWRGKLGAEPI